MFYNLSLPLKQIYINTPLISSGHVYTTCLGYVPLRIMACSSQGSVPLGSPPFPNLVILGPEQKSFHFHNFPVFYIMFIYTLYKLTENASTEENASIQDSRES